jgi:hypothetical protein
MKRYTPNGKRGPILRVVSSRKRRINWILIIAALHLTVAVIALLLGSH